jgi:hypothetical protein
MYEDTKEAMVTAVAGNLPVFQAKAQLLGHLCEQLSRPSFTEAQAQYKTLNPME